MPAPVDHFAQLHPLEVEVLGLWEEGKTIEQIADILDQQRNNVVRALGIATGGTDHMEFNAMVRHGTARLGAAISAYFERAAA